MGIWAKLAIKQLTRVGEMNSRDALRLVAYWQGRLPIENQRWRPVLRAVIFDAPERKRITSRFIATDLALKLIFGETLTRPRGKGNVQVAVVDYIERAAREMDRLKPGAAPPNVPNNILDAQIRRLASRVANIPARKSNWGWLLVIAVIAMSAKKQRR